MPNRPDNNLDAEATINLHDKTRRLEEEAAVLAKTRGLKGISAEDLEVRIWQVTETIAQGALLRKIVNQLHLFQTKDGCDAAHQKKTVGVKLFGTSYQMPMTAGIVVVGFLTFMALKKNGFI